MPCIEKIVIIGSAGAGKSTLARQLGKILSIEVFHLDRHFWGPNWKEKSASERKMIQRNLMQKDRWIIEGTYLSTSDERLGTADMIIFLDIKVLICLWRVFQRYLQNRNQSRPDLPLGCTEKLRFAYILKVLIFPRRGRLLFLQKWQEFRKVKNIIQLTSPYEVESFLRDVAANPERLTIDACRQPEKVQDYIEQYRPIPELVLARLLLGM